MAVIDFGGEHTRRRVSVSAVLLQLAVLLSLPTLLSMLQPVTSQVVALVCLCNTFRVGNEDSEGKWPLFCQRVASASICSDFANCKNLYGAPSMMFGQAQQENLQYLMIFSPSSVHLSVGNSEGLARGGVGVWGGCWSILECVLITCKLDASLCPLAAMHFNTWEILTDKCNELNMLHILKTACSTLKSIIILLCKTVKV